MSEPQHVVVFGDVMLDEAWQGSVQRISPEAPVPILHCPWRSYALGGAANVAYNLKVLGAMVSLLGMVGEDYPGRKLHRLVVRRGIKAYLAQTSRLPTTLKRRFWANGQQLLRVDQEAVATQLPESCTVYLKQQLQAQLPNAKLLILSDYGKGVLSPELVRFAIELAQSHHIAVVVDPKGSDAKRYRGAQLLTPNLMELASLTGLPVQTPQQRQIAVEQLRHLTEAPAILLTCGGEGMKLYEAGVSWPMVLPAQARRVEDVSGAGDTVVAAVSYGLVLNHGLKAAAELASCAAGRVVSQKNCRAVSLAQLGLQPPSNNVIRLKVLDKPQLLRFVARHRRQQKTVVFTNGCFDVLHDGHIHCLQMAKLQGDVLIVGINSDASVARLKGPQRPLVAEQERARLIAALRFVDAVVIFDEDTPEQLIGEILPDVLVKGEDYRNQSIAGSEQVLKHGGRVALIPLTKDRSTTLLMHKILQTHQQAGA